MKSLVYMIVLIENIIPSVSNYLKDSFKFLLLCCIPITSIRRDIGIRKVWKNALTAFLNTVEDFENISSVSGVTSSDLVETDEPNGSL